MFTGELLVDGLLSPGQRRRVLQGAVVVIVNEGLDGFSDVGRQVRC